jgi:branched-chain amino acid transport system substrate-binding protein
VAGVLIAVALAASCTEPDPSAGTATPATAPATSLPTPSDGSIVSEFAGEPWFAGTVPASATPADASLPPVVIGMINQENTAVGSFPEVRASTQAAANWINAELGGVNGRPIELRTCITSFSPEQSAACAQQFVEAGAVAVISGIDISSGASVPVLEQNGIPMISALPTTLSELRGTTSVSFSGSITGAYVAFTADAAASGAKSIALAYGEFESFAIPATDYAAPVGEQLGMDITLVPFPVVTADFAPILKTIVDSGADAAAVGAADAACIPIITGLRDLGYEGRIYMVGACAAEQIITQIPDDVQAEIIFNSEGPPMAGVGGGNVEGQLFAAVTERYVDEPAGGAGTVSMRAMMNLWQAMNAIEGDITPASVLEELRSGTDVPSFWGHPYTCDGKQVPGMPSMCSPQQTLFRLPDDVGTVVAVTDDWVDVPGLVAGLG